MSVGLAYYLWRREKKKQIWLSGNAGDKFESNLIEIFLAFLSPSVGRDPILNHAPLNQMIIVLKFIFTFLIFFWVLDKDKAQA